MAALFLISAERSSLARTCGRGQTRGVGRDQEHCDLTAHVEVVTFNVSILITLFQIQLVLKL